MSSEQAHDESKARCLDLELLVRAKSPDRFRIILLDPSGHEIHEDVFTASQATAQQKAVKMALVYLSIPGFPSSDRKRIAERVVWSEISTE